MYRFLSLLAFCTLLAILAPATVADALQDAVPAESLFHPIPNVHTVVDQIPLQDVSSRKRRARSKGLEDVLSALETMQDTYFDVFGGTWPTAIDWTAAVMGTHISATMSSLVQGVGVDSESRSSKELACADLLIWENLLSKYFAQTSVFYFGENALALRGQAYDDMLWVVLGWLENIKFAELYSSKHWNRSHQPWHGLQMKASAAHRAKIFYELASEGWDTKLCGGGMLWNSALEPYKNAITNELFAAASIGMYLYFPGDNNTSPFTADRNDGRSPARPHDPQHLENAIKSYKWLKESRMQSSQGLYQDGFHVSGWNRRRDGTIDPGTGKCDSLNTMVYTYNQGVLLSASRGLWLATSARSYIDDGHYLIESVINATGWPGRDKFWRGLGRNGILEEFCDHQGYCSQDGQTFKGIFFHHLIEFCRPLWPQEEEFLYASLAKVAFNESVFDQHLARCASYGPWIEHNAKAAWQTRDEYGLFGMWWGISANASNSTEDHVDQQVLPHDASDYRNPRQADFVHKIALQGWDPNRRGRGRTVETQSGGLAVARAHYQWMSQFHASP